MDWSRNCFFWMTFIPARSTSLNTLKRLGFLFCLRFPRSNVYPVFKKYMRRSPMTATPSVAASNP
jgi:hypothetical protein